jgi:hypothetical protein
MERVDQNLDPYAEHSYVEIGAALGVSEQAARATAIRAIRKLQRLKGSLPVKLMLETGRELRRVREASKIETLRMMHTRLVNCSWDEVEAHDGE